MYFDRQTNILHILKKNVSKLMTLEETVSQILYFISNSSYTIKSGTVFSNFNIVPVSSDANVYPGYGIFQSTSNGIIFYYGEANIPVTDNKLFYFHSGEITIQMEVK